MPIFLMSSATQRCLGRVVSPYFQASSFLVSSGTFSVADSEPKSLLDLHTAPAEKSKYRKLTYIYIYIIHTVCVYVCIYIYIYTDMTEVDLQVGIIIIIIIIIIIYQI